MLHKFVCSTNILELGESDLRHNSTKLSASGRNTVGCRSVTRREYLSRSNECGGVWPEILEEISKAVKEDESLLRRFGGCKLVVAETLYNGLVMSKRTPHACN